MAEICTFGTYAKLFILDLGINWAMAIPAIIFKTEKYFDLTGAITNIALAVTSYALRSVTCFNSHKSAQK